jgi:hypothetical protein
MVDLVVSEPTYLFHVRQRKKQPDICFQNVSNRYTGRKRAYLAMFPAKFPAETLTHRRAA